MQQADTRLIIEGAAIGPGIFAVVTGDDWTRLHHVGSRLRALSTVIGFALDARDGNVDDLRDVIAHTVNTIDDIAQLADAVAREVRA